MNTLSNVIYNIIFALFFILIGALLALSLVLWFYAEKKILSIMCFTSFCTFCLITYSLSTFRFKAVYSELAISMFKTIFAITLSLAGCYTTQLTYNLAIFSDSSYTVLCLIAIIFVFSQMLSVYVNLMNSVKLIKHLIELYKTNE